MCPPPLPAVDRGEIIKRWPVRGDKKVEDHWPKWIANIEISVHNNIVEKIVLRFISV